MKIFKKIQSVAVLLSVWTMIFSPLAMGLESQKEFDRISQAQLKQFILDLGLNKKTSYKQFWDRTKHLYPAQAFSEIEGYFRAQPNAVMPSFEVTFTQSKKGEKIPTLKINDRGQIHTVQIIGELNEWARVNQISLSESDLTRVIPAMQKLNPEAIKIETQKKDFSRFEGLPRMNPILWKSMTPIKRAEFMVKMRLLWFDARRVIEGDPRTSKVDSNSLKTPPSQKNAQPKGKKTSSFEEALKLLIGEEAVANVRLEKVDMTTQVGVAAAKDSKNKGVPCINPRGNKPPLSGGACIVAGQVAPDDGTYTLTNNFNSPNKNALTCACDYRTVMEQRTDSSYVESQKKYDSECSEDMKRETGKIANAQNGQWVACNPVLYSFQKSGRPHCIHSMSQSFQQATVFDPVNSQGKVDKSLQSCDQKSRLNSSEFKLNPMANDVDKYTMSEKDRILAIEKEQLKENLVLSKNFLDGVIARNKGESFEAIMKGKYDSKFDELMIDTQKAFEAEIQRAVGLCSAVKPGAKHEKFRDRACEQLHRRWLFTEKFLADYRQKACPADSDYQGVYDRGETVTSADEKTKLNKTSRQDLSKEGAQACKCKTSGKLVELGAKSCEAPARPPVPVRPIPPEQTCPNESTPFEKQDIKFCMCASGKGDFPLSDNKDENLSEFLRVCHSAGTRDEINCAERYKPVGAGEMEPVSCLCKSNGELPVLKPKNTNTDFSAERDYPPDLTIESKLARENHKEEYTCGSKFPLWPLLAIPPLLWLLFRNKDKGPKCALPFILSPENSKVGSCICPLVCPGGTANQSCTDCSIIAVCQAPKTEGTPATGCFCPKASVEACQKKGAGFKFQPESCVCEKLEQGTNPGTCANPPCGVGPEDPGTGK